MAAALDDFDDMFAILHEAGKLDHPSSAVGLAVPGRCGCRRWHLQAGQARQAEELITALPEGSPAHTLLRARWTWPAAASVRCGPGSGGPALRPCVTG